MLNDSGHLGVLCPSCFLQVQSDLLEGGKDSIQEAGGRGSSPECSRESGSSEGYANSVLEGSRAVRLGELPGSLSFESHKGTPGVAGDTGL